MNKNFRFKLNRKGISQILKGEDMQSELGRLGEEVARRCGEGYESDVFVGKTRANVSIRTKTREAVKDNMNNNTLLKNMKG